MSKLVSNILQEIRNELKEKLDYNELDLELDLELEHVYMYVRDYYPIPPVYMNEDGTVTELLFTEDDIQEAYDYFSLRNKLIKKIDISNMNKTNQKELRRNIIDLSVFDKCDFLKR